MDYFTNTSNGKFWVSDLDNSQSIELYYYKIWEKHLLDVIDKYVQPGTIAIDAGANFGSISIPISKKLGDHGKLYSFEMSPSMTERLNRNIHENKCSNIKVINSPLSDDVDQEVFFEDINFSEKTNFGDIRINKEAKGVKAKTKTIDSLELWTKDQYPDIVSFIKVDCQGYDLKVIRGAEKTITKHKPVVVFEWEAEMSEVFNDTIEDAILFFHDINYEVNKIDKDDWIALPKDINEISR
tara:strand:+ start:372 stop:1091 length:720 start_codon:yes stop_codon:yes gene_type:complete